MYYNKQNKSLKQDNISIKYISYYIHFAVICLVFVNAVHILLRLVHINAT